MQQNHSKATTDTKSVDWCEKRATEDYTINQEAEMKRPNNINELRDNLNELFMDAANDKDKVDLHRIKTASNVAGKIIGTLRTQIEYSVQRGESPNIKYLNVKP